MSHRPFLIVASIAALFASSSAAGAQGTASGTPHVILVKLVAKPGSTPYAFDPANITAPEVGERNPAIRFRSVVFPQPDGPSSVTTSADFNENEIFSSTECALYAKEQFWISSNEASVDGCIEFWLSCRRRCRHFGFER